MKAYTSVSPDEKSPSDALKRAEAREKAMKAKQTAVLGTESSPPISSAAQRAEAREKAMKAKHATGSPSTGGLETKAEEIAFILMHLFSSSLKSTTTNPIHNNINTILSPRLTQSIDTHRK